MTPLPKKLACALEAVLYVAYHASAGPVSSREIADKQGLPPRYLEQLMQQLVRAGLLRGVRGPRGGYVLAKERRRITAADIARVLHDEDDALPDAFTRLGEQVVQPVLVDAIAAAMQSLAGVTLAELCERAGAKKIPPRGADSADFAI